VERKEEATKEARGCCKKKVARARGKGMEKKEEEKKKDAASRLHREGERLRSEPETDELMLETTGGPVLSSV